MNQLKGNVRRLIWTSSDEQKPYSIFELEGGQVCKGPVPPPLEHDTVTLRGTVKTDSRGQYFAVQSLREEEPITAAGFSAYISRHCEGIGPRTALAIWDLYGVESLNVMRTSPEEVAGQVPRLTAEQAAAAAVVLQERASREPTEIALTQIFDGLRIPHNVVESCWRKWRTSAPERIRHNPFCLLEISGIGFPRADAVYIKLGKNPWALKRVMMCMQHIIASDGTGHTWHDGQELVSQTIRQVGMPVEDSSGRWGTGSDFVYKAAELGVRSGRLRTAHSDGKMLFGLAEEADAEQYVANRILALMGVGHDTGEE